MHMASTCYAYYIRIYTLCNVINKNVHLSCSILDHVRANIVNCPLTYLHVCTCCLINLFSHSTGLTLSVVHGNCLQTCCCLSSHRDPFIPGNNILVLCETYDVDGSPHPTNTRHSLAKACIKSRCTLYCTCIAGKVCTNSLPISLFFSD